MLNVALLCIATRGYKALAADMLASADEFFLPDANVVNYTFADADFYSGERHSRYVETVHHEWPGMTLRRWHMFNEVREELLRNFDYIFYVDADAKFVKPILKKEICGDGLTATIHHGYSAKPRSSWTFETRRESKAYTDAARAKHYFTGCFQGGTAATYMHAAQELSEATNADWNNGNLVAVWHDESHWNRYLVDNPPRVVLPPAYAWDARNYRVTDETKIIGWVRKDDNALRAHGARIIIGALSGASYPLRRDECRRTWVKTCNAAGIDVVFLIGGYKKNERVGDELRLSCPDDYPSLPQKTRLFCEWATRNDFDFLFKCDDDTYVAAERLLKAVESAGDYTGNEPSAGDGYASGGAGYLLSARAAKQVAAHLHNKVGPEDLLTGRILARRGIKLQLDKNFQPWNNLRPTKENSLITSHYLRNGDLEACHREMYG